MIVVVDASVLVDALISVDDFLFRLLAAYELHAPASVDAEIVHGLRRQWFLRLVDETEVVGALQMLETFPIVRHPVTHLVERMWALRENITAYDAGYVALAESLGVPLLTRDGRLSRSSGHTARIEYIE